MANDSWGPVVDTMIERGVSESFRFLSAWDTLIDRLVGKEVDALNEDMSLAQPFDIFVKNFVWASAYFDPNAISFTMCREFESNLRDIEGYQ